VNVILALILLQGTGTAAFHLTFWSMLPDTVEYGEFRGGVRTEGVIFGLVTFAQKTALGLGIGALGVLLDFIGYQANEEQSASTLNNIRFLFTLVPAGFALAAGALIALYPIDAQLHGRLVRVLEYRRRRPAKTLS
jgi:GPH family glycoside/pentoside/hexuronide:cation symporter